MSDVGDSPELSRGAFLGLEPTLGADEQAFRLEALPGDRRQLRFVVVATAILLLAGNISDVFVSRLSAAAVRRLWLFGAAGTLTCAVALLIGRLSRPAAFDRLVLFWVTVLVVFCLALRASGAPGYNEGSTVLLAVGAYTLLPGPLLFRFVPVLLLTAGDLWLLARADASLIRLIPTGLTYSFVHVIGIWSSAAYQTARRRQFAIHRREVLAREELNRIATIDELTGLLTRRQFFERAEAELRRHRRYGAPCSFCIADLDFFKRVNDQYGHQVGDEVLRRFAQVLVAGRRESDLVGRVGGEEFGLLLPGTPRTAALETARRMLEACRAISVAVPGAEVRITCSIGIAEATPDVSLAELVRRADVALYQAKGDGRDQVRVAGA